MLTDVLADQDCEANAMENTANGFVADSKKGCLPYEAIPANRYSCQVIISCLFLTNSKN
jgi:hypothetical protein